PARQHEQRDDERGERAAAQARVHQRQVGRVRGLEVAAAPRHLSSGGCEAHTRSSSSFVPKSPHGRTSSIASRQRNGETSARSGSPYRTDSTSTAATMSAPGMTPARLSSPPTSATAKAFRPRTPSEGSRRTLFA